MLTNFFSLDWVFFYSMALTIIGKCQAQLINTDYSTKVLAVEECAVDKYGPFNKLLKTMFKKTSKKKIWDEIIKKSTNYHMSSDYIKELWARFDPDKLQFNMQVDLEKLRKAIYL